MKPQSMTMKMKHQSRTESQGPAEKGECYTTNLNAPTGCEHVSYGLMPFSHRVYYCTFEVVNYYRQSTVPLFPNCIKASSRQSLTTWNILE